MATLHALRDSKPEPLGLVLTPASPRERRIALSVVGASEWKNKTIHYPPEPVAVTDLVRAFAADQQSLSLTTECAAWHSAYVESARFGIWVGSRLEANWPVATMSVEEQAIAQTGTLYPYQRVGAMWLYQRKRGILGDAPGLGKTPQAIVAARTCKRVLIVTLNPVKQHWLRHVALWAPGTNVAACEGTRAKRQAIIDEGHDWLIINHEMLRPGPNAYTGLTDRPYDALIFDEAHKFQGRQASALRVRGSQQSTGAAQLEAERLYMLTGTPVWNRPESIWNLLHLLEPRRFSSYWRFVGEYCNVEITPLSTDIVGIKPEMRNRLKSIIAPLLLTRKKETVAPWLPAKRYVTVPYSASKQQRRAYNEMRNKLRLTAADGTLQQTFTTTPIAAMRRLLNIPCFYGILDGDPKHQALNELVQALLVEDRKFVIFTWHKDYATHLHTTRYPRKSVLITGDTPDREAEVARYVHGEQQILIATIGAVGTGVDGLQVASAAIFAEASYVPTLNAQAEDRLHRIGTKVSPVIYRLYAERTVEEYIWQVSDDRKDEVDDLTAMHDLIARVLHANDEE